MRREEIERHLEKGGQVGTRFETGSEEYLGWLLLTKETPNDRYLALLEPGEEDAFVEAQAEIRKNPYRLRVVELSRAVHESGRYEQNEDFRRNTCKGFSDLDEVAAYMNGFGKALSELTWSADLDSP